MSDLANTIVEFTRRALAALADDQRNAGVHRGDDLDRGERVEPAAAAQSLRAPPVAADDGLAEQWEGLVGSDGVLERLSLDDAERLSIYVTAALELEPRLGPMVACLTDAPSLRYATVQLVDDIGVRLGWPRHTVRRAFASHRRPRALRLVRMVPGISAAFGDSILHADEWLLAAIVDGEATRPLDGQLEWLAGKPGGNPCLSDPILCGDPDPWADGAAWAVADELRSVAVLDLRDADGPWSSDEVVVAASRQALVESGGLLVRANANDRHTRRCCETVAGLGVPVALHSPSAAQLPVPPGWRRLPSRGTGRLRVAGDPDTAWSELAHLATRLDAGVGWGDLIVPARTARHLREVAAAIANHDTVMESWGFGRRPGAVGISVLCNGPSGTGKTLACRVLAAEVGLDLWMVDLASVTDKYLGESEKRLDRVLTAAAETGAMLLFDEADAVFGRRGEAHEARDRWANLEVSYLLQRIEWHPGVTVLTTNMAHQLDAAFERRLSHRVEFTLPDAALRKALWHSVIGDEAPLDDPTDLDVVATRFELSGGAIRNAAVNAAFDAAGAGSDRIALRHLVKAVVRELGKGAAAPTRSELGPLAAMLDDAPGTAS
jgi:hypothetical protein